MEGSGQRALFSVMMAAALVVTLSGASSANQDGACEGWTPKIPGPPFDEHAIVVHFDWSGTEKYAQHYYVVPAGASLEDYPSLDDGEKAQHTGGCPPELHDPTNAHSGCRRIDPLILTEASLGKWYQRDGVPIPHNTHVSVPGSYTLAARPGFICGFADDLGVKSSYERYGEDLKAAPKAVKLTATIEYYEGGAPEPHHSRKRSALVPLGDKLSPDQELAVWQVIGEPIVLPEANQQDPWAGEAADRTDAQILELPPLDPRIGLTEAGSLPGPNESPDSEASGGAAGSADPAVGVTLDLKDQARISRLERALYWLARDLWNPSLGLEDDDWETGVRQGYEFLLAGIGFQVKDIEARGGDASELREAAAALNLFWGLRSGWDDTLDAPDDATSDVPPERSSSTTATEADHPDDSVLEEPGRSALDTLEDVDSPGPPSMGEKAQQQGRVWVSVPAEVKVDAATKKKPDMRRTLKPDTWYQLRISPDGDQVFYSNQGKYLGKRPGGKGTPVQVRVWIDWSEDE